VLRPKAPWVDYGEPSLSVSAAAKMLNLRRAILSDLVNGNARLSA
jgi:plasmid maintenance system antidote protein VapI